MKSIQKSHTVLCVFIALSCTISYGQDINPLQPSNRVYHDLFYHQNSNQVFMFGGTFDYGWEDIDITTMFGYDVNAMKWNYLGINYAVQFSNSWGTFESPAHSLAYDSESEQLIFFNNQKNTVAYDVHANTWERFKTEVSPDGRCGQMMVYDSESDKVILFGGFPCTGGNPWNETWSYDYNSNTWTLMDPDISPAARMYGAMVYAEKEDKVYMWGGRDLNPLSDTILWEYDYNSDSWNQIETIGGPDKTYTYAGMVYHPVNNELFLFGGGQLTQRTAGVPTNEGWIYNISDSTWTMIAMENPPPPISKHSMAYISATDQIILYGGDINDFYSKIWMKDTWLFDYSKRSWKKALFSFAGNDRFSCASDMESIVLGGEPTAWGGSTPYTYTWEGNAFLHGEAFNINDLLLDINSANPGFNSYADSSSLILTVEDQVGTISKDTVNVNFSSFNVCPDLWSSTLFEEDSTQLNHCIDGGTGPLSYQWQPQELVSDPTIANPWTIPGVDTIYELTVTDTLGCFATSTYSVNISTLYSESDPEDRPKTEVIFVNEGSISRMMIRSTASQTLTMQILNSSGAYMEQFQIYQGSSEKQIKGYSPGIYFYRLFGREGLQLSGKFILD